MWLIDRLPLSDSPDVRERVEELFSRKMLGAVLVGKFVGDYAALKTVQFLGVDLGYVLGIVLTIAFFVYWDRIERKAKQASDELRPAQTKVSDFDQS